MATVLQGITPEQLAYIGQLYQAGQIPLPPALGPAHTPAVATQTPPATHQVGASFATRPQEEEATDGDKEDGEWEEGELAPQVVPDFLRPPPTGPRKRSGSFHLHTGQNGVDKRTKRQPSPPRQPHSYDRRRPAPSSKQQPYDTTNTQTHVLTRNQDGQSALPARSHARQRAVKHDAAKIFILAAYRAGYSFDDLSREVGDNRMLQILFKELGLNAPAEKVQPKQPEVMVASPTVRDQPTAVVANKPVSTAPKGSPLSTPPTVKPAVKSLAKPVIPPKAPATADRSAYLAKLQAAKNKKNEDMLTSTKPVDTVAENKTPAAQQPSPAVAATGTTAQPTAQQPAKAKVQTDLLRRRLEALKGEQARRQEAERLASAQSIVNTTSVPTFENVDAPTNAAPAAAPNGLAETPVKAPVDSAEQAIVSPAQSFDFAVSQFPGLPGLFMTGTPPQIPTAVRAPTEPLASSTAPSTAGLVDNATSEDPMEVDSSTNAGSTPALPKEASEQPQASVPAKSSAFSSGQATPKHPFNQGKYDSNDDSVIIHVSDEEESELDDMDEDEDDAPSPVSKPAAQKPGPLRNLPTATIASVSTPGTPGATTPGGTAYQRKLQEIQEMNRRIAEMQKQPKKAKLQPATSSMIAQTHGSTSLPGLSTSSLPETAAVAQPKEQQAAESSQQMEAELARLQEEAAVISQQRQVSQSDSGNCNNASTMQSADSGVVEDAASNTSDDDDAMDLSSGGDSDSSDEDDVETRVPEATEAREATASTTESLDHDALVLSHEDASGDTSTSDDSDSSTESEEESDEDYEPAPAVSEVNIPNSLDQGQQYSPPISAQPVPQFDADLAPELQPSARVQDEPTSEVSLRATAVSR